MTKTVTAAELAEDLGLTVRRVRQLAGEGVLAELPDRRFDPAAARRAYRIFSQRDPNDIERLEREVVDIAEAVEVRIMELADLPPEARLPAAVPIGALVCQLIGALTLLAALAPAGARRDFERGHVNMLAGLALGSYLTALGVEIMDDAA